jgi:hypothetical protein
MAFKKYLHQLDIQAVTVFTTVTAGFIGFGAKADGLYQKIGTIAETRMLTANDVGSNIAAYSHSHSGYAATNHTHSGYAATNGNPSEWFNASEFKIGTNVFLKKNGNDFEIWHENAAGFTFDTSGVIHAVDFANDSDIRLKQNIRPIVANLDIRFVEFTMKADATGRKRYGVIAQELEKLAPELVYTNSAGMKSVAYIDLLVAKIDELEKRLKKLENE